MIDTLHTWLKKASTDEQQQLADAATNGSINTLFQYALGRRNASAAKAATIEAASKSIGQRSKGRLPVVLRTDLVPACRDCPFARACLGKSLVERDFKAVKGG